MRAQIQANVAAKAEAGAAPAAEPKTPKGYVMGFFDFKCPPPEWKEKYAAIAEPTIEPYGGKFLIKHPVAPPLVEKMGAKAGGSFAPEGQQTGQMAFMLEFPSFDKAQAWFVGPEYAAVLAVRDELSDFRMVVVEEHHAGADISKAEGSKLGYVLGFFDFKCPPPQWKEKYAAIAEPTLENYGGSFIVKHPVAPPLVEKMGAKAGGSFAPEGQSTGQMAFVLQFESFDKAQGWFTGPEYGGVLTVRDELSDFRMVVVEQH